jgi:hypothetical protein
MTPIQSLADNLAALGRYEDTYMIHAAQGETVVPGDVLDANPILKGALFAQMKAMGIDEPSRYVVGSNLNSINPITGQPEFFFKKIKRLVKKIAAPVGGTIGFMIGGPTGAAIGSGLGSLVGGGTPKQALTAAALGGVAGYGAGVAFPNLQAGMQSYASAIPGIGGLIPGGAAPLGYNTGFASSVPGAAATSSVPGAAATGASNGLLNTALGLAKEYPLETAGLGIAAYSAFASGAEEQEFEDEKTYSDYLLARKTLGSEATADDIKRLRLSFRLPAEPPVQLEGLRPGVPMAEGGSPAVAAAALNRSPAATPTMTVAQQAGRINQINQQISGVVGQMAREGANIPELRERKSLLEAEIDKILNSPNRTSLPMAPRQAEPPPMPGAVSAARGGGLSDLRDQMIARQGFPRRSGQISGLGGETDDLVPAMLSNNEFVFTADAVKGAGGGSVDLGTDRMYAMMNQLERRA